MKFGLRTPSLKKRISARLSPARYVRHSLGLKASRGLGWLTNPKKAAYNSFYNRSTTGFGSILRATGTSSRRSGCGVILVLGAAILLMLLFSSTLKAQTELPAFNTGDTIVRHSAYTLKYDKQYEQADWVEYRLTRDMLAGGRPSPSSRNSTLRNKLT